MHLFRYYRVQFKNSILIISVTFCYKLIRLEKHTVNLQPMPAIKI